MTSFIEYLLESKANGEKPNLIQERYESTTLHAPTLAAVRDTLTNNFNDTDVVKLCCPIPTNQTKSTNARNEFEWQPGNPSAKLNSTNGDAATVREILADINAIANAGGNLNEIRFVVAWNVAGHGTHDQFLFASDDDRNNPGFGTVWIGVRCSDEQLEAFVADPNGGNNVEAPAAQEEQPQQPQPNANAENADAEDEPAADEFDVVNGQNFKELDEAGLGEFSAGYNVAQALSHGPVMVGRWNYQEFLTKFSQLPAQQSAFFKTENGKQPIRYKQINWDDSVDSFVKRLGHIAFYKEANSNQINVVMELAFNGHPTIVKFRNVGGPIVIDLLRSNCSSWFKTMVKLYMDSYKTSRTGIEVLFDKDRFFRTNSKYRIQQDPPFIVGLAAQNATTPNPAPAAPAAPAAQGARPQAQRAAPRRQQTAIAQLKTQVNNVLAQNHLVGFSAFIGQRNGREIPKGYSTMLPADDAHYMVIAIPGAVVKMLVGNDAIQFLQRMRLWDGKVKPAYDVAKTQYEDLKLALYLGARLR